MSANDSQTRVEGSGRDRQIVAARVIVTCPGRNFVTLRIETRAGVVGLGDATLNGRELAVAAQRCAKVRCASYRATSLAKLSPNDRWQSVG
jgi:L-alanine-DL-glutamate epimerase-like enolase superfamily enzyme